MDEMKPGGGKQKGSAFEREVSKKLSLWITHNKREDVFWRSAMSGGRATLLLRRGADGSAVAGDIASVHPHGTALVEKFLIECKSYKDLQLDSALVRGGGNLIEFWHDTCEDAAKHEKFPMLIAKQNYFPTILCLPMEGLNEISNQVKTNVNGYSKTLFTRYCPPTFVRGWLPGHNLYIFLFDKFLEHVDPEVF